MKANDRRSHLLDLLLDFPVAFKSIFMFRLQQLIQNTFLRILGFFQRLLTNILGFFAGFFGGLAKVLGLTDAANFLEFEDAKGIQAAQTQQTETAPTPAQPSPSATRRRPDPNMDYFRNLAREIRTPDSNHAG
jgi:hypothetical protein